MKLLTLAVILILFELHLIVHCLGTINCSSVVTSGNLTFNGCEESIGTESLTNPTDSSKTIYSFKGIPYAEPPLGPLRFLKTVPKSFSGPTTINATNYRNPCMQTVDPDAPFPYGLPSEDCLFINVWTPTLNSSAALPVMFWIHGGGFNSGSGSQLIIDTISFRNVLDGSQLALRDVIIVTFNYRLGVFGFLYGNSTEAPGNVGLWDQAMALNWTRQNIGAFGGNPNNITIFGESAGSMSVSNHIVSNVTRNWFQRAIMQSGSSYFKGFSRDTDFAYGLARNFTNLFRICNDNNTWIHCLRNMDANALIAAQTTGYFWNSESKPRLFFSLYPFPPIFGDEFLPFSIPKALKDGNYRKDIKILIGHNEMEGELYAFIFDLLSQVLGDYIPSDPTMLAVTKNAIYSDIKNSFIDNNTFGDIVANKYTETFTDLSVLLNPNPIRRSAVYSLSDYIFICPTILFGGYYAKNALPTGKVYQYRLTYASTQSLTKNSVWANVAHADDMPLVFGHPFRSLERFLWSDDDRKLSKKIMDIWTHFAIYDEVLIGNGNVWPNYSVNNDATNSINASYVELNADDNRFGRVYVNRYDGIADGFTPSVIGNCFNFWDAILSQQF